MHKQTQIWSLYRITNKINGKIYIGQASDLSKRWSDHRRAVRLNKPTQIIHHAIIKYGIDNFEFEVIASSKSWEDANETETLLVAQYDSFISNGKGYNATHGGMNAPKSKEWCNLMSEINKRRFEEDPEFVEKLRKAKKIYIDDLKEQGLPIPGSFQDGHEMKPEWIEAISQANLGRVHSDEEKENRSKGLLKYYENIVYLEIAC